MNTLPIHPTRHHFFSCKLHENLFKQHGGKAYVFELRKHGKKAHIYKKEKISLINYYKKDGDDTVVDFLEQSLKPINIKKACDGITNSNYEDILHKLKKVCKTLDKKLELFNRLLYVKFTPPYYTRDINGEFCSSFTALAEEVKEHVYEDGNTLVQKLLHLVGCDSKKLDQDDPNRKALQRLLLFVPDITITNSEEDNCFQLLCRSHALDEKVLYKYVFTGLFSLDTVDHYGKTPIDYIFSTDCTFATVHAKNKFYRIQSSILCAESKGGWYSAVLFDFMCDNPARCMFHLLKLFSRGHLDRANGIIVKLYSSNILESYYGELFSSKQMLYLFINKLFTVISFKEFIMNYLDSPCISIVINAKSGCGGYYPDSDILDELYDGIVDESIMLSKDIINLVCALWKAGFRFVKNSSQQMVQKFLHENSVGEEELDIFHHKWNVYPYDIKCYVEDAYIYSYEYEKNDEKTHYVCCGIVHYEKFTTKKIVGYNTPKELERIIKTLWGMLLYKNVKWECYQDEDSYQLYMDILQKDKYLAWNNICANNIVCFSLDFKPVVARTGQPPTNIYTTGSDHKQLKIVFDALKGITILENEANEANDTYDEIYYSDKIKEDTDAFKKEYDGDTWGHNWSGECSMKIQSYKNAAHNLNTKYGVRKVGKYLRDCDKAFVPEPINLQKPHTIINFNKKSDMKYEESHAHMFLLYAIRTHNNLFAKLIMESHDVLSIIRTMSLFGRTYASFIDDCPLIEAVKVDNYEMVKVLLNAGVNGNSRDGAENTPIMIASKDNKIKMLKVLLSYRNCHIEKRNRHGDTALMLGCEKGHIDVIRLLIPRVNINVRNNCGWSALMFSRAASNKDEVMALLLQHGAEEESVK